MAKPKERPEFRALRYLPEGQEGEDLKDIIRELRFCDLDGALDIYAEIEPVLSDQARRFLGCNDRFYLLTSVLGRVDLLHPWLYNRCREVEADPDGYIDLWARYHYKDLRVNTPVLTTKGWKAHGDLKPGDQVYSPSGQPVRVVATRRFTDSACYRVTLDNGIAFECGAGHLWKVDVTSRERIDGSNRRKGRRSVLVETSELAALHSTYRPIIAATKPLQNADAKLPIDPYVLGAWLGDGRSDGGSICGQDPEIFAEIERRGHRLSHSHCANRAPFELRTVYGLLPKLRALGVLRNKHIPLAYLLASEEQRLDLLRGLIDTDGHVDERNRCVVFAQKCERLTREVQTLANSLGFKARVTPSRTTNSWHAIFQADDTYAPCLLSRKRSRLPKTEGRRPGSRGWRVVSVERIDTVETNCIQVDSAEGMYLAGKELIPTHNSTICTLAGIVQEVLCDPEITVCILSVNKTIAGGFFLQIQQEFENNETLKSLYPDVCWADPRKESPRWSRQTGIVLRRQSNPKEATVEAWGLIDGQPTSKHYGLLVYDDVVTQDFVGNADIIRKVTERWELSDNLGTHGSTRKWHQGTRYHFGDTYGIILERGTLKARVYPATEDGTLTGNPVLLSPERWEEVKDAQRSTVAAQMLLDPIAGNEAIFSPEMFKFFEARPSILNVYIMVDPSKGRTKRSDRTAIAVVGVDQAGMYWLIDGYRHRMQLAERWARVKELHKKWTAATGVQIVRVGWERYGKDAELEALELLMQRDNYFFEIEELNWPYDGQHSKTDRVSRLEPDMRNGRFRIPGIVYRPQLNGIEGMANVSVRDGKIHYEPYRGPSKLMRSLQASNATWRQVGPIKRIDEEKNVYDVTSAFIEEAVTFPFSPKDDLVDAVSRIYDMQPTKPVITESQDAEQRTFEDS